jgi:deazaflavin-dependent oxidoreductase (nitroreductase family)
LALRIAIVAGVVIIIAAPLLVRFRPRWVAAFNLVVTNRIAGLFVTRLPGFGVITHIGRKSGKTFHTPVKVYRAPGGFLIALTYGPESQWVQNVVAAGQAELETRHTRYHVSSPTVVHDPSRQQFPFIVGLALRIIGATDFLRVSGNV